MISRTLGKNIRREIFSTLNRFLAIFAITALGAGFFAGLRATGPDMQATADAYFTGTRLADVRLLSTMGFTDEDIATLWQRSDVEVVQPGYTTDVLVQEADGVDAVRLHALPVDAGQGGYLNELQLTEGTLPQKPGEAVADSESGYKLGDTVTLDEGNTDSVLDMLAVREFTVVGIADSPVYISFTRGNTSIGDGSLSYFLYLHPETFDIEFYTEVYLTLAGTEGLSSASDEYLALAKGAVDTFEDFGEVRAEIRYNDIWTEATEELEDAKRQLAEAREEADEELADAAQQLEEGGQELADARAEIARYERELADAEQQLADGERELAEGRRTLENAQREYEQGLRQYADGLSEYEQGVKEYNVQLATFEAGRAEYQDGVARYNAAVAEIAQLRGAVDGLQAGADGLSGLLQAYDAAVTAGMPDEAAQYEAMFLAALGETAQGMRQLAAGLAGVAGDEAAALAAAADMAEAAAANGDYIQAYGIVASVPGPLYNVLNAADAELADTANILAATAAQIADGEAQLAAGYKELEAARVTLESSEAQLAAASRELNQGWATLAISEAEIADYRTQMETGRAEIQDAKRKLADGEAELLDGRAEYEEKSAEAEEEFAKAEAEIADGEAELVDLEMPEWYVYNRDDNPGYSGFGSNVERISAIATIIPYFFFLVAALVCLTTMTRMVEEQRTQIGTYKALGFGKGAIAFKYILYAGLASLTGGAAGVAVGYFLFPDVIWNAYRMMYLMPSITYTSQPLLVVQSVGALVLVTTLSTVAACFSELRSVPAQLMRPKAPKSGTRVVLERIPFVWNRLKFSQKVTVRNLFRYKKRFFMTVVGVSGCTALLITGFGLGDSISGIVEKQFGVVQHYDITVALSSDITDEELTHADSVLHDLGKPLYLHSEVVDTQTTTGTNGDMTTYLTIAEDPVLLGDFVTFQQRKGGHSIEFPQGDGIVLTEKLASQMDAEPGSTVRVNRADGQWAEFTVAAVMENYAFGYVYMTAETYEAGFGIVPEYDTVQLQLADGVTESEALQAAVEVEGVLGAVGISEIRSQFDTMLESLNSVVWVIILCAALLAFVVLYNLTNINITERQREIATLKVLGFYNPEVASYVYRENLLLTAIGTVAGLVLGLVLHRYVVITAEIDEVMFGRAVELPSYLYAILFTLLCAVLVNLVMLRKLKNIDMVESLKSAE